MVKDKSLRLGLEFSKHLLSSAAPSLVDSDEACPSVARTKGLSIDLLFSPLLTQKAKHLRQWKRWTKERTKSISSFLSGLKRPSSSPYTNLEHQPMNKSGGCNTEVVIMHDPMEAEAVEQPDLSP